MVVAYRSFRLAQPTPRISLRMELASIMRTLAHGRPQHVPQRRGQDQLVTLQVDREWIYPLCLEACIVDCKD